MSQPVDNTAKYLVGAVIVLFILYWAQLKTYVHEVTGPESGCASLRNYPLDDEYYRDGFAHDRPRIVNGVLLSEGFAHDRPRIVNGVLLSEGFAAMRFKTEDEIYAEHGHPKLDVGMINVNYSQLAPY